MGNIVVSNQTLENLQKLAEANQTSVNELAEIALNHYIAEQSLLIEEDEEIVVLDPEELAELQQAAAEFEADEATGFEGYTAEEVRQRAKERIANHFANKQKAEA